MYTVFHIVLCECLYITHIGSSKNTAGNMAYGIIFLFEKSAVPRPSTCFICVKDSPYIDNTTKQPVCPTQKPINFLSN